MAVGRDGVASDGVPESPEVIARYQRLVGWMLRMGAFVAVVLLFAGLVFAYIDGGTLIPAHALSGGSLGADLRSGGPSGLMLAGLIVLVLTPVARVGTSFVMFAVSRDRAFAVLTVVVLGLLAGTALVGSL